MGPQRMTATGPMGKPKVLHEHSPPAHAGAGSTGSLIHPYFPFKISHSINNTPSFKDPDSYRERPK